MRAQNIRIEMIFLKSHGKMEIKAISGNNSMPLRRYGKALFKISGTVQAKS